MNWLGVLDPSLLDEHFVATGHRLADAARDGDWATVVSIVDESPPTEGAVNRWRPGGTSWFTPLHQAAWLGASPSVVRDLLERGALRSLRDSRGRTPRDIAVERGHGDELRDVLDPPGAGWDERRGAVLDDGLAAVIDGRIGGLRRDEDSPRGSLRSVLRYPPVEILNEVPGQSVWFAVPGMLGGFSITLRQGYVESISWSRVVGGSGQAHVITREGVMLVDERFV